MPIHNLLKLLSFKAFERVAKLETALLVGNYDLRSLGTESIELNNKQLVNNVNNFDCNFL